MDRNQGLALIILFVVVVLGLITAVIVAVEKRRAPKLQAKKDAEWLAQSEKWNQQGPQQP